MEGIMKLVKEDNPQWHLVKNISCIQSPVCKNWFKYTMMEWKFISWKVNINVKSTVDDFF